MDYRSDFPLLNKDFKGKRVIYLDSAATSQKPWQVINAVNEYVTTYYANPHRGAYAISQEATDKYEGVRKKTADLIGVKNPDEIVFTKNSTEALNLIAYSWGEKFLKEGDEIVISVAEHHANLVPWQRTARKTGAVLKYMYVDEDGRIPESELSKITEKTKAVSVTHVSNVTGRITDIIKISEKAHSVGAVLVCDGSQAVPHFKVEAEKLGADFYVFTGHKLMSYTGAGVLWGKMELLEKMDPFLLGGDMIEYVEEQSCTFNTVPHKFEAGTPLSEAVISLGAAIDYLNQVGYEYIGKKDRKLTEYLLKRLEEIEGIKILGGNSPERTGVVSFTIEGIHSHDIGWIMDSEGICVRSGHHCAQPFIRYLGVPSSTRISLYFYNEKEEIDEAVKALKKVREIMGNGA